MTTAANSHRYTATQQKVLAGMALATAATFQEHAEMKAAGTVDFDIVGALLDAKSIARSARVTEYQARQALATLTERGDVVVSDTAGMGGAFRAWKLCPELTEAALARFGVDRVA